jgi:hypothetical protein
MICDFKSHYAIAERGAPSKMNHGDAGADTTEDRRPEQPMGRASRPAQFSALSSGLARAAKIVGPGFWLQSSMGPLSGASTTQRNASPPSRRIA